MDVSVVKEEFGKISSNLLVMFYTEEEVSKIRQNRMRAPKKVRELIKPEDFTGEEGSTGIVRDEGKIKRIMLVGLGKQKEADLETLRKASSLSLSGVKKFRLRGFDVLFKRVGKYGYRECSAAITEGVVLGNYDFDRYKQEEKKKKKPVEKFSIYCGKEDENAIRKSAKEANVVCENVNMVRDLVNEGGDEMNPDRITQVAKEVARKAKLRIRILEEPQLKKMGMNLLIAVGQGSRYKPRLVILEHRVSKGGRKTALVGKGITFDTGGLYVKPSPYMDDMRSDKAGALTVLGTMKTIAELKIRRNVVGVMPLCENAVGPESYKPGSVIKSFSGKTVQVVDTDAEGRLILADAMAYAEKKEKAETIIDIATLTGSCLIAFGEHVAAMLSNSDSLAKALFKAGERTHERVWRMPYYKEYAEEMKGDFADVKNVGYERGRYAGVITAGAFLKNFVETKHWAHLDIAGAGWYRKPRGYIPSNATGFGVRLLTEYLR